MVSDDPDKPLTAAQLATVKRHVEAIRNDVGLKQWCIEKALAVPNHPDYAALARAIHDFVAPPASPAV